MREHMTPATHPIQTQFIQSLSFGSLGCRLCQIGEGIPCRTAIFLLVFLYQIKVLLPLPCEDVVA